MNVALPSGYGRGTLKASIGGHQPQQRDFRLRTKLFRGAPVPGAPAGVGPEAVQAVQPGGEGLLQRHP